MRALILLRPDKTSKTVRIDASLPYILTEEEGGVTAHTPVLDFATCGKDHTDAEAMFDKGIRLFLQELVRMGTLDEVLREHGWQKCPLPQKPQRWVLPELVFKRRKLTTAVGLPA